MRSQSFLLVAALAVAAASCYSPTFREGLPCTADRLCPGDQVCNTDGLCFTNDPGPSGNAVTTLSSLVPSQGELEPAFDPAITEYTLDLGLRAPDFALNATTLAASVDLTVAGAAATSGEAAPVDLAFGSQSLAITITNAEAESTTYTVTADRGAAMEYRAFIKASNAEAGDLFGGSTDPLDNPFTNVAISGNTIAVGAPGEAGGVGGINGPQDNNTEPGAGAVYVFVRASDGSWSQQAYIKPIRIDVGDGFGTSLALDGDTLVVGAPEEDSNDTGTNASGFGNTAEGAGAAYVFVRNGPVWSQQAMFKASNTDAGDGFGYTVAVSGDTIVVGAPREASDGTGINPNDEADNTAPRAGAAYVFVRAGTSWSQQAYVKASNAEASDFFGAKVALVDDSLLVGAPVEFSAAAGVNGDQANDAAPGAGAAYLFERTGSAWAQTTYLKASNPTSGEIGSFGMQLAIGEGFLVVGRPLDYVNSNGIDGDQIESAGDHVGTGYVFRQTAGSWEQEAFIKPSNSKSGALQAYFSNQVATSGNLLAIAAPQESSDSVGFDGDQSNRRTLRAGALYLLIHDGAVWSQSRYVKAPIGDMLDYAGNTGLGISAEGTLVFTIDDDSASQGIDGDPADNSAVDSGAIYVIE